jgi:translation elongation factor EF-1beta
MKRNEVLAKIEQVKTELVDGAFPSLFSKEDVQILFEHILDAVGGLEDEAPASTPADSMIAIERSIKENVESVISNFNFDDTIELSIGWGNQIEIDVNVRDLRRELNEAIEEAFQELNEVEEVVGE